MKYEELKDEDKKQIIKFIRNTLYNRLNIDLKQDYKNEQISIMITKGSVIVTIKILSMEEVKNISENCDTKKKPTNLIQFRPSGKNGIFFPVTEIGEGDSELNKAFQDASNIGGMTLT